MFGGLYTGNEASSKSILNKNTRVFYLGPQTQQNKMQLRTGSSRSIPGFPKRSKGMGPPGEKRGMQQGARTPGASTAWGRPTAVHGQRGFWKEPRRRPVGTPARGCPHH